MCHGCAKRHEIAGDMRGKQAGKRQEAKGIDVTAIEAQEERKG